MAAASGDRPIQKVLGNPNDFNDLYRPPSVKVVFFTIASAKTQTPALSRFHLVRTNAISSGTRLSRACRQAAPPNSRLDDASALSGHPSSPWQRRTNVWRR